MTILTILLILSALFAPAAPEAPATLGGECYPISWDKSQLTIRWDGYPGGLINAYAIMTLENVSAELSFPDATDYYWQGDDGSLYLRLNKDFSDAIWRIKPGLYCYAQFATYSDATPPSPQGWQQSFFDKVVHSLLVWR